MFASRFVYDTTEFVRASIDKVVDTLLEAIALVVLVVILFLQTGVPRSFADCRPGLYHRHVCGHVRVRLFDQCADAVRPRLAIGIVVDDAIVVVENVERNIENGLSPRGRPIAR